MHPTLFEIGSFKMSSFGAIMVVSFIFSLWLARARAAKFGFTKDQIGDVAFVAIIAGILGARAFFIIQDLPYYLKHLDELFSIQFKGLTSFGGFIVGGVAAAVYCKVKRLSAVGFLDLAAPAFLIGHAIGRIACLLNGCCHGHPAASAFPFLAFSQENNQYNVPAQLYDSVMNLAVLGLVLWMDKKDRKPLYVFGMTFFLHGITRFIYEFFRAGSSSTTISGSPFTEGHVVAMLISVFGLFFVLKPTKPSVTQSLEAEV
jgi:phosphatidylglycerol---prolipoprotein diacylglyceryl transferase